MSLFSAVWLANLNRDQPFLQISEKEHLFWGSGIPQKLVENLLFYLPYFSVGDYLPVKQSPPKISLIREKPALLFWDIPVLKPVWLSGAESKLKITANSTYWEANLNSDHPFLPIREKNTCFEYFPLCPFIVCFKVTR
jgi:hypothetical protein